jgi:hypothetical protein
MFQENLKPLLHVLGEHLKQMMVQMRGEEKE